ncbi:DoxX family protein [Olivibacter sp. SDN3]|uniref:DoxX family protein n=1 Tax=Olivibacter sp. SDN3 TaxID=2764720 RepID=UPI00165178A4|nr:DoxX family protein [Olivibacter sp. SDN3]QNL48410.1 DoxX family protein [Olivibacter sp. SDN3]
MFYNRPNLFFRKNGAWAPLFIRLIVGFHLIYGVHDNIIDQAAMGKFSAFLSTYNFPAPPIAAYISVYAQLICGILFVVGYYLRIAALLMIINFTVALLAVHISDSYTNMFPALFMLFSSFSLFFSGAGKFSADQLKRNSKRIGY